MWRRYLLLAFGIVLAGCGSASGGPSPPRAAITVRGGPAGGEPGWKTVVYGGLQVSVPADWGVQPPVVNEGCGWPSEHTVVPLAYTEVVSASCPSDSVTEA